MDQVICAFPADSSRDVIQASLTDGLAVIVAQHSLMMDLQHLASYLEHREHRCECRLSGSAAELLHPRECRYV
jgi:hypothetical protein